MEKSFEQCVSEGTLSEIENLRIYHKKNIFRKKSVGLIPQERPVAIILGGQNASGKSTLGKKFLHEFEKKGRIASVDGDTLRDFHPKFKEYNSGNDKYMVAYTAKDSGRWTERLIDDLSRNKCNMIVETTLRNKDVVTGTVEKLIDRGYDVQAKIFVVSYDKSLLGTYARYEKVRAERGEGRFVFEHSLNAAYNGMPETLQALKEQGKCSCIHLYTREGVLFEGDYRQTDIVSLVKQERNREYTPEEKDFIKNGWEKVTEQMHNRHADKSEYEEIANRMVNRIESMTAEGASSKNIKVINDLYISDLFPKTKREKTEKVIFQAHDIEKTTPLLSAEKAENKRLTTYSKDIGTGFYKF